MGIHTLVVGIDAACWPVVERLPDRSAVSTIERLGDRGVAAPLESAIPPWTASAWPSLYTGTNPGKHGVFGFLRFDGYDWDVVNATDLRARPVWELADRNGLTSAVVNAPVTHPPRSFDGALVPGYTAPEDPECHPPGLLDDVRDRVGDYRLYSEGDVERESAAADYRGFVRSRGAAFRYLADRFDPEFGFVQFQQTDTVCHEFPADEDLLGAVYGAVDDEIAAILDACDPDTVILASDHGIGPCEGREFRVNEFLRERGFVETATDGDGMPTWVSIREGRLRGGGSSGEEGGVSGVPGAAEALESAMGVAARAGLTTQRAARVVDALGLTEAVSAVVPDDLQRAGAERVDFRASAAYVRDPIELGVRINLAGRDPEGVVDPDEYESVRRDLIEALQSVRTPDGDPVFEDVAPREAYFHGPEAERAVDVVTVPADFDQYLVAQLYGDRFGEPSEPWTHKRTGMVVAAGDAVDAEAGTGDPHLFDVAPTVCAALGIPRSDRMDGSPLPFVEPTDERRYPPREARERVRTDDDRVTETLADLGYIDRTQDD
ncbi:alkaline phosphatase family protein [Halosimplex aquaticum]|uniref:Alkaline phosphatase family protein n=1 Tax=Halosimplex aquaticum TaxID=3026162 RepID=A0ABD5Y6A9_9EURY